MGFSDWYNQNTGNLSDLNAQNEALKKQIELQKQSAQDLAGMQLQYNPIEETVGPDGKKTIGLRPEFQLQGPEKYISAERERLKGQQASDLDKMMQTQQQQEAQARANLSTRGGLKGANPMLLNRYSMRDAMLGQQGLLQKGAEQSAELESKGQQLTSATQEANLKNLLSSATAVNQFNLEKWKKQKEVEAAKYSAQATAQAGQK